MLLAFAHSASIRLVYCAPRSVLSRFRLSADQGVQYTSKAFQSCLDSHGITQSISRPGTPLDNAVAESCFKTQKRELMKGKDYKTMEEATQDIFKYIELYYNTVRMYSALDYDSPVDYE